MRQGNFRIFPQAFSPPQELPLRSTQQVKVLLQRRTGVEGLGNPQEAEDFTQDIFLNQQAIVKNLFGNFDGKTQPYD
ncbi:hypothetical protein LC653_41020 [Nostoc sp. CHAB 5784]|uniref:hypothetical protein n=1 Tax=Nostoc mirabile TaxID=2907820 RepID=UPI001E414AD9|nr:hypothetical protein [Nostoc mirabile]MCC5670013.1 hypothetical protein [Nostoc mirabile CHAB5784]